MGILNLAPLIKNYAPEGIQDLPVEALEDKIIAVDASLLLYQFLIALKNNNDLQTKDGRITSHIHAIIMKVLSLSKKKIKPLFVFDGTPPELKDMTLQTRKNTKKQAESLLENTSLTDEEKLKLIKKTVRLTNEQMAECQELLALMGVPFIQSPGEADAQCAYLVTNNIAYGVMSEDMDLLTFGCKRLIRCSSTRYTLYDLNRILEELDVTYYQFIDMCILLGSDYCPSIKGIGKKRAYDLIKKYGSIENLIENEPSFKSNKYTIPSNFQYKQVRQYFLDPPVDKIDTLAVNWNEPKYDELSALLVNKYEYKQKTANNIINNLKNGYYSVICGRQTKQDFDNKTSNNVPMFI